MSIDRAISIEAARKILGISRREITYWREFGLGPVGIAVQGPVGMMPYYVLSEICILSSDKPALEAIRTQCRSMLTALGRKRGEGTRHPGTKLQKCQRD